MKNKIFFIVCISFSALMLGQEYEIGLSLGGTNYVGDVGSTRYINPNRPGAALFFKYNLNPRIALRTTYSYLPIQGDNKNADRDLPLISGIDVSDYSFTNTINELALGMEFNFYEYDLSSHEKSWTPYILIELVAFNYKSPVSETAPNTYSFNNKTSYSLPVSLGYKSKLFGNYAYAIETKFRYTFEDDLDYSTERIPSLNFGGTGRDWYMFTGVSLIYTFGRPACYSPGL